MNNFDWPAKPFCHEHEVRWPKTEIVWTPPRGDDGGPYDDRHRTCSFCGSVHPSDLLDVLSAGAEIETADWKHGWPSKLYVVIPNPKAGITAVVGRGPGGPIMGAAPQQRHLKFYNQHLVELSREAFDVVATLIQAQTDIKFDFNSAGQLRYQVIRSH